MRRRIVLDPFEEKKREPAVKQATLPRASLLQAEAALAPDTGRPVDASSGPRQASYAVATIVLDSGWVAGLLAQEVSVTTCPDRFPSNTFLCGRVLGPTVVVNDFLYRVRSPNGGAFVMVVNSQRIHLMGVKILGYGTRTKFDVFFTVLEQVEFSVDADYVSRDSGNASLIGA